MKGLKAAGRDKGLFLRTSVHRSVEGGGPGPGLKDPPYTPRLQPAPRSSGPPGLPPVPNPPKLKATLPGLLAPLEQAKGPELALPPPFPVGPASPAPSCAARPGTGAGSPGRRFQGTGGEEEEPAGPAARPPSRPEPAPPPLHPNPGPGRSPSGRPRRPALTGRRSPPGREQERRRGIQRLRPGPGRSAARRSTAPPPAAARAEPKGSSLLAAPGINGRPSWQRLGAPPERARRAPGAALETSVRVPEALPGGCSAPGIRGCWARPGRALGSR
ncbi:unnamed protein product [Rangifer tarandus platyrhynchus]|uniref:Uncharacterized protein n=2 Tax=Rangifer tarandus platyrhynchus TaxID=3082113 RepID=A0ACB0EMK7_RANTA|nr:unnamed protein product [Rangifer tarandus platyrhynchus]CAI9701386.1 unnamed protein product [Rangifer tarandus platyrhynchus]